MILCEAFYDFEGWENKYENLGIARKEYHFSTLEFHIEGEGGINEEAGKFWPK